MTVDTLRDCPKLGVFIKACQFITRERRAKRHHTYKYPPHECQRAEGVAYIAPPVTERRMGECRPPTPEEVSQPPAEKAGVYYIRKHGRAFAVYDPAGMLVCVVPYLKGAREVVRRLGGVAVYTEE